MKKQDLPERDETFYAALLDSWVSSRMERDRSLLTLSTAGVGLTITLIASFGAKTDLLVCLYGLVLIGFLATTLLTLSIFKLNATYLKGIIKQVNGLDDVRYQRAISRFQRALDTRDRFAGWFFGLAVIASVILGFSLALTNHGNHAQETQIDEPVIEYSEPIGNGELGEEAEFQQ